MFKKSFWVKLIVLFFGLSLLASCGSSGSSAPPPPSQGLMLLVIAPSYANIYVGNTQQFTATGWYLDGTQKDLTQYATWTSSNTSYATVNNKGLATGVAAGSPTITATYGGYSEYAYLYVTTNNTVATLTSISVMPTNSSIAVGTTQQLTATGHYSDGSTQDLTTQVTWSSTDTTKVTINSTGLAYGVTTGSSTITATLAGISGSTLVTAKLLTQVSVTPTNSSIVVGTSLQFMAIGTFSDGSTQDLTTQVTWSSSDTTKATINSTGLAYSVGVGSPTITATLAGISGSATVMTYSVQAVSLATNDIIYDSARGKIYASIPGSAGSLGNTITSIDPVSGATITSVYVGSEPGKLAISDDDQFLYVALNGSAAVRRVTLSTMTPDIQFSLGSDSFNGPKYAEDMVVLPGYPHSVAVSTEFLGVSPSFAGVAVYDDSVQRSVTIDQFITTGHCIDAITSSGTATMLYGYNNETTEYGFYRMNINSSGISIADETGSLISGFGIDIAFGGGLVYATTGQVVNPSGTTPILTGTFSGVSFAKAVAPDSILGKTFFLFDGSPYTVSAFDQSTFRPLGSLSIQGNSGTSSSLIRWGTNGLAFRTNGAQLFLIESSLVQ